ncbi:MAG: putative hydroxymethylpyrimidine transporter CytX, partial [Petrotogales bacterium]
MAKGLTEKLKITPPPEYGIKPVPSNLKNLRFLDYFVLWSSLGVGLLVFWAGLLLVPGLGLGLALLAILVGHLIGNLFLALVGTIGSENGIPSMVAVRPSFGIRSSYLMSILNVIQLVGWASFEILVMGQAADAIMVSVFGYSNYAIWVLVFGFFVFLLAFGGPLAVIRDWLRKFAIWLIYGLGIWITIIVFTQYDLIALLNAPSAGTLTFSGGVDLVIAMPISWVPLVADYNRFSRNSKEDFSGTYIGFLITSGWCYALGAITTLATGEPNPVLLIMMIVGPIAAIPSLLIIVTDETDNGFADVYSAAISTQNIGDLSKIKQWKLIVIFSIISTALALVFGLSPQFEEYYTNFLLWIGSVFIPLFGIVIIDYFVVKEKKFDIAEMYKREGEYWYWKGLN